MFSVICTKSAHSGPVKVCTLPHSVPCLARYPWDPEPPA